MDTTTPPRDENDRTAVQPTVPPPLIEPTPPPGSRAAGATAATGSGATIGTSGAEPEPAPVAGGEDPSAPDAAVETTVTVEPAGSRPESEPVAPTAEPASVQPVPAPAAEAQPATQAREVIYVATPTPPRNKGNRGIGAVLAVLSAVLFLVLYALVWLLVRGVTQGDTSIDFLRDRAFYIPMLLFVVAFVVLALVVNRAGWWAFVLGSLLVGLFVYFGTIGALLLINAGRLTPAAAEAGFRQLLIDPLAIAAGLVAREVALWVGAAISARGRRVKARNAEARADFEREQESRRAEFERGGTAVRPA